MVSMDFGIVDREIVLYSNLEFDEHSKSALCHNSVITIGNTVNILSEKSPIFACHTWDRFIILSE